MWTEDSACAVATVEGPDRRSMSKIVMLRNELAIAREYRSEKDVQLETGK